MANLTARGLVQDLRVHHPEGFAGSNPNEHLVKKLLSLLVHATDEGSHNYFRKPISQTWLIPMTILPLKSSLK